MSDEDFLKLLDKLGFPSNWTEKYLKDFLDAACEVSKSTAGPFLQRVEVYIQIATNELAAITSKRNFRSSILLSIVAIVISIGVSMWTGYSSDVRSKHWEENQLKILQQIKEGLK